MSDVSSLPAPLDRCEATVPGPEPTENRERDFFPSGQKTRGGEESRKYRGANRFYGNTRVWSW